jgi:1-acyl-sn-glycerol-3-phosphate acyltransferase
MRRFLRGSYRTVILVFFLLQGVWFTVRHGFSAQGRERLVEIRRNWYRRGLAIAGVRVRCLGEPGPAPALVLANHVSWLDIPVVGSALDVRFLSKSEVARWPVVGFLARRNHTLFIRRGGHHTEQLSGQIAEALRQGERVVLFPEGTTTRGTEVRRFHPRLLAAAVDTGVPVQPIALDYGREPDGSAPRASYSGDDVLLSHAWWLLCRKSTSVTVRLLPMIHVSPGTTRSDLAETARTAIVRALDL